MSETFSVQEDPFYAEDLAQMAKAGNYRRWQFEMVAPHIKGRVLEVGGGIGSFTVELARSADSVLSIEPNAFCFSRLSETTKGLANVKVLNSTVEALGQQLSPGDGADTIILMNVLEHIRDDGGALDKLRPWLRPGGRFVVLVPAGQWAFGSTDQRLGHFRRYTKESVRKLVGQMGMKLLCLRYYNFVGIWGWWWNNRITRRESQDDRQIALFDRYFVPVLSRLERLVPPPVGQSLLFVAGSGQT